MDEGQPEEAPDDWGGDRLRWMLKLLAVPGVIVGLALVAGIHIPSWLLYVVGAGVGAVVLRSTLANDPEPLLAMAIVYLPLSKIIVAPIAPGINGTNILFAMLLVSSFRESPDPQQVVGPQPVSRLVLAYAALSLFSVLTAIVVVNLTFVIDHALDVKGWLDQFIVYFTFSRLIRDGKMARRLVVYMMVAATVILVMGFQEWLEKRDASTIEKGRLLGPQMQPNDFGAFVAYAAAPFFALLLVNLRRPVIVGFTVPYLLGTARVLLATFSRGAYLGAALAGIAAVYVRGKLFLAGALAAVILLVATFPQVVPHSLRARMGMTQDEDASSTEGLDTSSQTRLILWDAALKMTKRSPVFGYGFKTFPVFKGDFTETEVPESDNHNMYLYLSSQMGLPALIAFALILWKMAQLGIKVYRATDERFTRVVGMSATALAAGAFLVNMFGSRMVDICVSVNFWITLAIVSRLAQDLEARALVEET